MDTIEDVPVLERLFVAVDLEDLTEEIVVNDATP